MQSVLSQTLNEICSLFHIDRDEGFREVQIYIEKNSKQWREGCGDINYCDPFCRMAYLYMNVAVHSTLVEQALKQFSAIKDLIRTKSDIASVLNVCAIGGGPGSELLGLVRYVEQLSLPKLTVDFLLIDQVYEWDESWHALKNGIESQLKEKYGVDRLQWPIIIERSFLSFDATKSENFTHLSIRLKNIDLFIISYFISEQLRNLDGLTNVFQLLASRAKNDAIFLFIDRDERQVKKAVESLINVDTTLVHLGSFSTRDRLQDDLKDLGEWYINIPFLPRKTWLAFFTAAQKKLPVS